MAGVPFKTLADEWRKDPNFVAEHERIGPAMEIAFALSAARHRAKLTQAEVARRMGSSQSAVNRWERGRSMPSAKTIERFAAATGSRVRIELIPV